MLDAGRLDLTLGIVGAGVMGRGIAQVAAEAGITVLLADARAEAVAEAAAFCAGMLRRKAAKGAMSEAEAEAAAARIRPSEGYAGFAGCHVVVEAVAERLEAKHAVLAAVEAAVPDGCIVATNTSSLSVTAIAAGARRPERVAGFHFFNPVPLQRLVEVIPGIITAEWVCDALDGVARRMGHHPVRASDTPGFLVNHAGRAFGTEALRIVGEGIAAVADVDRVMVEAAGFRMGPFAVLDLAGLDVSRPVMEGIYHHYYEEPRYRPSVALARLHEAGLLGRKTGRGFYAYPDGKAEDPPESLAPAIGVAGLPVWVSNRYPKAADALRALAAAAGAAVEAGSRPGEGALILLAPFGEDATTAALAEGLDPTCTVAVDCLFPLERRRTLMRTPITAERFREAAHALLAADGTPVTVIRDSPGFIAQRIVAGIVNVGADIAQQRIAAPEDIDRAVELGLSYPRGPLGLGDALGPRRILGILEAMQSFYGDPRYRPSPWLKRRALLGVSLKTEER